MSSVSKKRSCPAVGREITSAECGENRGSRYACPAECGFNPFAPANYGQLLELEKSVDDASLVWLKGETADRAALLRDVERACRDKTGHTLHAFLVWRLFLQRDAQGLTCAQRWERAGFPGLKNDQRVLVRAKMGIQVALLEVRRVLDDERVEAVDLLAEIPAPFVVVDRSLAAMAGRFDTLLAWVLGLPHFHRIFGSAELLPEIESFEPRTVVEEIVRHLGGPADSAGLRLWLAEHLPRFDEALSAVTAERRRLMLANIDAKFGKAVYELRAPFADVRALLDAAEEVDDDPLTDAERQEGFHEARAWFAAADDEVSKLGGRDPILLGRVLLRPSHWRLEATGAENLAKLRARFERLLAPQVKFVGERLDDVGRRLADENLPADRDLIPPRLLENPPRILLSTRRVPSGGGADKDFMAEMLAERDRAFLDGAIPALQGRTPREAARDPALRRELIRLMKARVRQGDQRNRETGSKEDVTWMLRELGLDEIIFEPPPANRVPRTGAAAGDENDEPPAPLMNPRLPPTPPLPDRPLTAEEVHHRLRQALEPLRTAAEASQQLQADGCTLIDAVTEVTMNLLDDKGFSLAVPLVMQIWFVFVPPRTRGPNLRRSDLWLALQRETTDLVTAVKAKTPAATDGYLAGGPQPVLAQIMLGFLLRSSATMPEAQRPSSDDLAIISAVLRAIIAELDRAHREWPGRRASPTACFSK